MKFVKFCTIGFFLISSFANAVENGVSTKSVWKKELEKTINLHTQNKYLSLTPKIEVNLVASFNTLKTNAESRNIKIEEILQEIKNQPESYANTSDNSCYISVVLDDEGNLPFLTNISKKLPNLVLNNPTQKKMAQEFLTLHESFHCEFRAIENPIIVEGTSENFQKKINFLLKDDLTFAQLNKVAYIDLLNENYADVSATFALINQYGADNKDLLHVLNTITNARHYSYFEDMVDVHFSHFSLKEVMEETTLLTFQNEKNNPNKIKSLALSISNRGVNKVLQNKPMLNEFVFTKNGLIDGIYINALTIAIYKSVPEELKQYVPLNVWANDINRGYVFNTAYDLLKDENTNLKFHNNKGEFIDNKSEQQLNDYVLSLLKKKLPNLNNSQTYLQNMKEINEFKSFILKGSVDTNNIDYIVTNLTNEELNKKVNYLNSKKK